MDQPAERIGAEIGSIFLQRFKSVGSDVLLNVIVRDPLQRDLQRAREVARSALQLIGDRSGDIAEGPGRAQLQTHAPQQPAIRSLHRRQRAA